MKMKILAFLIVVSLGACGGTDSTETVRDNETPVAAQDQVDNRQVRPDTLAVDTSAIR